MYCHVDHVEIPGGIRAAQIARESDFSRGGFRTCGTPRTKSDFDGRPSKRRLVRGDANCRLQRGACGDGRLLKVPDFPYRQGVLNVAFRPPQCGTPGG